MTSRSAIADKESPHESDSEQSEKVLTVRYTRAEIAFHGKLLNENLREDECTIAAGRGSVKLFRRDLLSEMGMPQFPS